MEVKLLMQGRHVYNVSLATKLKVIDDIFSTRSTHYNGMYRVACKTVPLNYSVYIVAVFVYLYK